ncbi:dihydropteroate synthase [Pseudosulfitobacter pseudonitzschiae]|uniref:dihydropteroate synthase n=1 Tax=Pseudosulfitobacter pseudonitzschiae TaxID=1402135 RepID=UPI001AF197C0|nr:dihydropteroate synthase [Pseudosulfitobacter pseudonitzschiae]MBM1813713.1 dihydropteroate synthase [Pseudosulfitobacter pseudonitzschiae]MBM1830706.1 dihydropteroate synthase [Pseudosulfitobacter pseudonitzschiae]MBM1835573.1 dihydropteroate synthase [Pseudosulfitobacter pseudonitzschiae]MBM1840419.1 dihydropteroate synthase [Pseudosulfitobacter pseudonitzschiae]MBM1845593.1 dihydropteroate synthase [Pseudosulfitobacter pseudonitzschiae]
MTQYFRPLVQVGAARPDAALTLAGGWGWFTHVEVLERGRAPVVVSADQAYGDLSALTHPRAPIAGLEWERPHVMGILNVTPDSFSDGGQHQGDAATAHAVQMVQDGAVMIDVGGESTRPGAETVDPQDEITRTAPAIAAIRAAGIETPISIDTRKAAVAAAALDAGADVVNDVAGFTYDAALAPLCAFRGAPVCVMHAQGDPATMHHDPHYDDVLLDVYDYLKERIAALTAQGIVRDQIIADPGIGFGKTLAHNMTLLNRLSLFHGLGVPILLGVSRKRFIGTLADEPDAAKRGPGSVGVALAALGQGVQLIRAHDVALHTQAIALWQASVAHRSS